jgi:hypothetical protein
MVYVRGQARGALAAFPLILAVAVALTGCGSDGDGGDPGVASVDGGADTADGSGGGGTESDRYAQSLAFAQCMRENGVPMDDPDPGGRIMFNGAGIDEATMSAAQDACQEFAPSGPGAGGGGGPQAEAMLDFAQCMRENGVEEFPDPEGGGMRINGDIADDPDFPAAQELCQEEFLPDVDMGTS